MSKEESQQTLVGKVHQIVKYILVLIMSQVLLSAGTHLILTLSI